MGFLWKYSSEQTSNIHLLWQKTKQNKKPLDNIHLFRDYLFKVEEIIGFDFEKENAAENMI